MIAASSRSILVPRGLESCPPPVASPRASGEAPAGVLRVGKLVPLVAGLLRCRSATPGRQLEGRVRRGPTGIRARVRLGVRVRDSDSESTEQAEPRAGTQPEPAARSAPTGRAVAHRARCIGRRA
jgi:hypothetical protein